MKTTQEYQKRLQRHYDELKWLYCELYPGREDMFDQLCKQMEAWYQDRPESEKKLDREREQEPAWYSRQDMLGMMLYIDAFAGNLKGVKKKLPYLEACNVNYLHLMPFLDTPKGKSDGGYAVADYRKVQPALGTMEELASLCGACHEKKMSVCMDFVMNHTSEDHEWAKRALAGEKEYQDRYFFYDTPDIPQEFEKTVPQVFPTTAPGNFTWLPQCGHYVMTTFYPYQWDLNYRNPRVFNEMMYNYLFLANKGMDIIRIDAVPYIWKELGTSCRNLPKVHTIVRMMRMIGEIVCPSVILLGEVVMEPAKVVPYFGTVDKPECHLLYNVTTMCTTWHTVATRDTRLLRKQLDAVNCLPKDCVFLNYLRCHDDIGWGLDFDTLRQWGFEEVAHKKYLNRYFQGYEGGSNSRGELYNDDPMTGDARFCATTASLCGIEKAGSAQDAAAMERAIRLDLTLHAMMLLQSGIPMLYSGDEIAQVNDYSYKNDPNKAQDSRYVHRGKLNWTLAAHCEDTATPEGQIFTGLRKLENLRRSHPAFGLNADVWTLDTGDDAVLAIGRYADAEKIIGVFNFSEFDKPLSLLYDKGDFTDLLTGAHYTLNEQTALRVPAYGSFYLQQQF